MKFLSLVCVFYKMCPEHRCCHQCPHHQYVTRRSPSPSSSLGGHHHHCHRSLACGSPLPSSSLAHSQVAVAIIVTRVLWFVAVAVVDDVASVAAVSVGVVTIEIRGTSMIGGDGSRVVLYGLGAGGEGDRIRWKGWGGSSGLSGQGVATEGT